MELKWGYYIRKSTGKNKFSFTLVTTLQKKLLNLKGKTDIFNNNSFLLHSTVAKTTEIFSVYYCYTENPLTAETILNFGF